MVQYSFPHLFELSAIQSVSQNSHVVAHICNPRTWEVQVGEQAYDIMSTKDDVPSIGSLQSPQQLRKEIF